MQDQAQDFELFSWGNSDAKIPSFDADCLSIAAYLNCCQANWVINDCNDTSISPSGELPLLRDSMQALVGTSNIINHLKQKGFDLDDHLTPKELSESLAYQVMIQEKLYDVLLYSWFLEEENYINSTRPLYSRTLPFLKRYIVPSQLLKKAKARLRGRKKEEVYNEAKRLYKTLAVKLGDKEYMFGESPSSLDCIAFGHLYLHALPSLTNPTLFSMLNFEFPTLITYINKMKDFLFSSSPRKSPTISRPIRTIIYEFMENPSKVFSFFGNWKREAVKSTKEERVENFWRATSIVGGISFFLGYIVHNEIIQFG